MTITVWPVDCCGLHCLTVNWVSRLWSDCVSSLLHVPWMNRLSISMAWTYLAVPLFRLAWNVHIFHASFAVYLILCCGVNALGPSQSNYHENIQCNSSCSHLIMFLSWPVQKVLTCKA